MVVSRPQFQIAMDAYTVGSNIWPLVFEQLDDVMDESLV
jgi:hypothetical protein